jgi:hypothetical protein
MIARVFMTASAAILLALGIIHLVYTFRGPKLTPRDPALQESMKQVSPVVSRETTMWRVWTGVNATHSLALILFGFIYGYLALSHTELLFASSVLLWIGFAMLLSLVVICKLYFFRIPLVGVSLSMLCYIVSVAFSRHSR